MYQFDKNTQAIIDMYSETLPDIDTVAVGFSGTVSERVTVYSHSISDDCLIFGFGVDFADTATDVLVRIASRSPQYDWMSNDDATPQDTPIGAVAGFSSQILPILPLVKPFFLYANGKLSFNFTNSPTSAVTGGNITIHRLKLVNPLDGVGYQYGFSPKQKK